MGPERKRYLTTLVAGAAGAALGALTTAATLSGDAFRSQLNAEADEIAWVMVQRMTLPVVDAGGRLASYMTVDFALEVPAERRGFVRQRVPEVRHAVNGVAWRTTNIATATGGIDIEATRAMLLAAARLALGSKAVDNVRILTAVPV
jgi:hypothetical protein